MDISPYDSVQKSELYAILIVLRDFKEPLNIVTNGKYAESCFAYYNCWICTRWHRIGFIIYSVTRIGNKLRNRCPLLYILHIWSHTGLSDPLAQDNAEINELLIGNVLKASKYHKDIMPKEKEQM